MSTVTGTIGGQSVQGYVRALHRRGQLCAPGQSVTINLRTSFPLDVDPAMEVSLQEQDTQTFTGYVVKASRERPAYDWLVECQDTYTRVASFFIDEKITTGFDALDQPIYGYVPQLSDYWIGYLMGLCGMSYHLRDAGRTVPAGVQIGLRTVHETLMDILAFSSQYAFPDEYGVLQIGRAIKNSGVRILSNLTNYERTEGDEWTRTTAKVFGYASLRERVFASASVSLPNIVPDRVTAVSSPLIETNAEAQRVADYLMEELGAVAVIATGMVPGDPSIKIGQSARLVQPGYSDVDVITSLETDWTEDGYTTQVTIGERCPRISGWSKLSPSIYAGTTQHGIYRSTDAGASWSEYNTGLTTGTKRVTRLGFNAFEEGMAIVNGSLWYRSGPTGSWSTRSLPSPSNMAGDDPAPGYGRLVAVDALGTEGGFAVLTTSGSTSSGSMPAESRSWIYTCSSTGSTPGSWESVEMSSGSATAHPYNLTGHDLTAAAGTPLAVLSSGSTWANVPIDGWRVDKLDPNRNAYDYWGGFDVGWLCDSSQGMEWHVASMTTTWYAPDYGETVIVIEIVEPNAQSGDYVYLYGSYGDRNDIALTDVDGERYWAFSSDASLIDPVAHIWRTSITLLTYPAPVYPYDAMFFNIFSFRKSNLSPQPSLTHGDICSDMGGHELGTSPYGDRSGGGFKVPCHMPFVSTLVAGMIYWA